MQAILIIDNLEDVYDVRLEDHARHDNLVEHVMHLLMRKGRREGKRKDQKRFCKKEQNKEEGEEGKSSHSNSVSFFTPPSNVPCHCGR